jgi:Zn-dependent peptidase ImmA (M78 family)/DNA-binding XRE family transcriptional regulator
VKSIMRKINPSRLKLARTRRKMTLKLLAEATGLTTKIISTYEKEECEYTPKFETLNLISSVLQYPVDFLIDETEIEHIDASTVSFRSLKSMRAADEHAAIAAGEIGLLVDRYLTSKFPKRPKPNLPEFRASTPEAAAGYIREYWDLGSLSINNMIHLLEKNGVRVFSLAENTCSVDAFSFWKDDIPFIFLNTQKSGERSRFDAAHELGHLIMHKHGSPQGKDVESEADSFAAHLLMPENTILAFKGRLLSLEDIIKLKKNWVVSAMALIIQMKNLGVISDWHYRTILIEASKRGLRSTEIEGIKHEKSGLLPVMLNELQSNHGIDIRALAKELSIPLEELTNLFFMIGVIDGGGRKSTSLTQKKANLRLV